MALEPYGSYSFLDSLLQVPVGGEGDDVERDPCPDGLPYRCPDGTCVEHLSDCPPPDDDSGGGEGECWCSPLGIYLPCDTIDALCPAPGEPGQGYGGEEAGPNVGLTPGPIISEASTGCMDPNAINYNPFADIPCDDCCEYPDIPGLPEEEVEVGEEGIMGGLRGLSEDRYTPDYEAMKKRIEEYYGKRGRGRTGGLLRSLLTNA